MEYFPSSCQTVVNSFVRGWTSRLESKASGELAGLYGSSCGSHLDAFYGMTYRPDWIWGGDWDSDPNAQSIACVSSSHWTGYTRHKQYRGGHNETYNNVTLPVDSDCAYGPVVASAFQIHYEC